MKTLLIIIYVAVIVLLVVAEWKIYTKAKQPGWACLIPFYNTIVLLKIVGKPWWWLLLLLLFPISLIWTIWMINLLSKSFGKDVGFTIGLLLLPFIFIPILGFGKAEYIGPAGMHKKE